jgi:hypothetical protein
MTVVDRPTISGQLLGRFHAFGQVEMPSIYRHFGLPRSTCRSIVANPRNPRTRDLLNERVKHREAIRPLAR